MNTQKTESQELNWSLGSSLLINVCLFDYKGATIYRRPLGMIIYPNCTFSVLDKRLYTLYTPACLRTALPPLHVVPLVSASYDTPLHVWRNHVLRRPFDRAKATVRAAPSAPKQSTTPPRPHWASEASCLDAPERARCVMLLTHSHLRRRRSASFGIAEGESCSCETTLT
jgi:hypothetical protein